MFLLTLFIITQTGGRCLLCHSEIRSDYEESIHYSENVGCVSCHGGDENTLDEKIAHGQNFRGIISRREIPKLCSKCHSDPKRMMPYGLPVDQYTLYLTSKHGRKLLKGDTSVAVCTDCHLTHRILKPDNPLSEANKMRLIETCGKCHGDSALMAKYGLDSDIIEDYRSGIHGRSLYEENNLRAPGCTDCHGSHGAYLSGFGDINKVCGICHPKERDFFRKGPHFYAMKKEKLPECEACHGNHMINSLTPIEGLETLCINCHDEKEQALSLAGKLKTLFVLSFEAMNTARSAIEEAKKLDVDVEYLQEKIKKAELYYTEATPILHSFDLELIETELRKSRAEAEDVVAEVHKYKLHRRERIFILIAIWFYILLTLAVIYQYRRQIRKSASA